MFNATASMQKAKGFLSKTEWTAFAFSALMVALIVIFGALHSEYFAAQVPVTNSHKLKGRCVSAECMDAAAWLIGNMDESIDPCDNFYDRACGNFALQHPFTEYDSETSVLSNMREKNLQRLRDIILSKPVRSQWGHMFDIAKTVNNFYTACIDQYERSRNYVDRNPLIPLIQKQLGTAWWVNDQTRLNEFEWQAAMRATARDLNFVFFSLLALPKAGDVSKNVLEVSYDTSPTFSWQNSFGRNPKATRTFRTFLMALGSLIARDNGTNTTTRAGNALLGQFADDVINVTSRLQSPIMLAKLFSSNSGRYHRTFNFSDFKAQPGNDFVNWDDLLNLYTDRQLTLRRDMPVVEHFYLRQLQRSYTSSMAQILRNFSQTDPDFRRKMNNYFTFRIAFFWMPDLNYEYNHLYQMYDAIFHGRTQFPDDWQICMSYVDVAMPKTLSALYVSKFYKNEEEKTVNEVSQALRKSLTDEVATLPWMDTATRTQALDKLSKIKFKIGKPAKWSSDEEIANELSKLYGSVTISPTDNFGNVRQLMKVLRLDEVRKLVQGSNPYDHWRVELYDVHIEYYARWNEVLIPAGILQEPIVSPKLPAYMNFGGLGSWIASTLLKAIDEDGQYYDSNYMKTSWWTQQTWDSYNPRKQSVIDFYDSMIPNALKDHLNTTTYAPFAIAETGGLRQAYTAYKRYLAEKKLTEKALPSIAHGNVDQMFFYSYASTHCADYESYRFIWRTVFDGTMPEFLHVNGGVSLMKEFGDAFQCPVGSAMVTPEAKQVPFIF